MNNNDIESYILKNIKQMDGKRYIDLSYVDSLFEKYDFDDIFVDYLFQIITKMDITIIDKNNFFDIEDIDFISSGKNSKFVDGTKIYFDLISKYPLLDKKEEQDLFERFSKEQNPILKNKIKEKIMLSNLRLVVSIAKSYRSDFLTFDDFVQEGNIGLDKAIDKFDITKGNKFSTYASWWIRQSISRARAEKERLIKRPVHVFENENKIRRIINDFEKINGCEPSIEELSLISGIEPIKLLNILIDMKPCFSLNKQISSNYDDSDDVLELADILSLPNDFVEDFDGEELHEILINSINDITINKTGADKYIKVEKDLIINFIITYNNAFYEFNVEKAKEINNNLYNHEIINKAIFYMEEELTEINKQIFEMENKIKNNKNKKILISISKLKKKRESIEESLFNYHKKNNIDDYNFERVIRLLEKKEPVLSKDYLEKLYNIQNKYEKIFNKKIEYYNNKINNILLKHKNLDIIQNLINQKVFVNSSNISIYDVYKDISINTKDYNDISIIVEKYINKISNVGNLSEKQINQLNEIKYNLYFILEEQSNLVLNNPYENYNIFIDKFNSIRLNEIILKRLFISKPFTLDDLANKYNITKERVRQLETRGIELLRNYFSRQSNRKKLRQYIDEDYFIKKNNFTKK